MAFINKIGIFGTSGMAREAGDIANALGIKTIYVTKSKSELIRWKFKEKIILEKDLMQYRQIPFIIAIAEPNIRKSVAKKYKNQLKFTNLIHPSATFGLNQKKTVEKSIGTIIAAGVRFTNNTSVGDFCIFNQNTTIAHDCDIKNYIHIAPGANISGNVILLDSCWIGAGAVINQGYDQKKIIIGENTIVGSGSVIIESCKPNSVYVGVPGKRIN